MIILSILLTIIFEYRSRYRSGLKIGRILVKAAENLSPNRN
jgi:hypothetical protein